jgi:murein DD-endopeptidase MepM/ murein hydrolase activator NlpD
LVRRDSLARPDSLSPVDTIVAIHAALFGEPLHFERDSADVYSAFAGIPVGAADSVTLAIVVARGTGATDTISTTVRIGRGQYRMEKLAVAPAFGVRPDSALAARIARENRQAADVSRRSHDTPRLWTAPFQRPRTARVTSGFGDGREFNGRIQSRHGGLDLAGAVGAPVVASNSGIVALVGRFYYAGNAVYIDHGRGMVTAYFHLSRVEVKEGQKVEAGQQIGLVGATGRVTGPHLHWVARYGGVSVDPATLLPLAPIAGPRPALIATPSDSAGKPRPDSTAKPPLDSLGRPIPPPAVPPPPPAS